jgi:hypothetical protein
MFTPTTPGMLSSVRASPAANAMPAATGSGLASTRRTAAWSSSKPGRTLIAAAERSSVNTATAAMTGTVRPTSVMSRIKPATEAGVSWLSTAAAAPARCFCASRNGRRCRGGAAGVSGTTAGIPAAAASAVSRGPSRSKTGAAPGWVRGRPSPVTHKTASTSRWRRAANSCSRATRFRSRQVRVTQGRAPTSCRSDASRAGGKSGCRW